MFSPLDRLLEPIVGYSKEYLGEILGIKSLKGNIENLDSDQGLRAEYYKVGESLPLIYSGLDLRLQPFAIPCEIC